MKRSLLFFAMLISLKGFCQSNTGKSLLWEISGMGLTAPSYLFGTFHIMCKDEFRISETLQQKIRSTKKFCGELDMDDPALQTEMMQRMMMPEKTLSSYLSDSSFASLNQGFLNITGSPISIFNHYKPFMCLSLLTIKSVPCVNFIQPETEFLAVAKKAGLDIIGLETVQEQFNAIDAEPIDSQILDVKKMVLNFDSIKTEMKSMIQMYQQNDAEGLYQYLKQHSMDGLNEEAMLIKRNQYWIPRIKRLIADQPCFIAVGAGHLGGNTGIIALLRKQGFTLKPMEY